MGRSNEGVRRGAVPPTFCSARSRARVGPSGVLAESLDRAQLTNEAVDAGVRVWAALAGVRTNRHAMAVISGNRAGQLVLPPSSTPETIPDGMRSGRCHAQRCDGKRAGHTRVCAIVGRRKRTRAYECRCRTT